VFLAALVATTALALPGLSGTVRDTSLGPIDGAIVTVVSTETGKGLQRPSTSGEFSISGLPVGEYLIKVENDGYQPVTGLVRLTGDDVHSITVVMLKADPSKPGTLGAGSPLRHYVRPERTSPKPPKVRPADLKQKLAPVYPEADRKAGVEGSVKLSMIILPDGTVEDLVVLSAPDAEMGLAALLAVRKWRYSPTYLDDEPVETSLTVDINFQKH
jgi:TonB family protein